MLEGVDTAGGEQEIMRSHGVLDDFQHHPRAVRPQFAARGERDGLFVVEGPSVRDDLADIVRAVADEIGDLPPLGIADDQRLAPGELDRDPAARFDPLHTGLGHLRGLRLSLKGQVQSDETARPLYCRASLVSPCRASIGLIDPASLVSRARMASRIRS